MGCVVNGPGEAREADLGIAGGRGKGHLFVKGHVVRVVPEAEMVDALVDEAEKIMAEGIEARIAAADVGAAEEAAAAPRRAAPDPGHRREPHRRHGRAHPRDDLTRRTLTGARPYAERVSDRRAWQPDRAAGVPRPGRARRRRRRGRRQGAGLDRQRAGADRGQGLHRALGAAAVRAVPLLHGHRRLPASQPRASTRCR